MGNGEQKSPAPSSASSTSEGSKWLDMEPDLENVNFVSLFDEQTFSTLAAMLDHCKRQHNYDLQAEIHRLHLDFLGIVRLINFIRSHSRNKSTLPKQVSLEDIKDECYLRPVIENDALIFSLDEILDPAADEGAPASVATDIAASKLLDRNRLLEAELETTRERFANYRLSVEQTLERRWGVEDVHGPSPELKKRESSGYYFESYASHEIHETMLKDSVRTDAYRDFIYGNKDLFTDKVVLDVGCGTGILSMFCAKAGAKRVIAVERSDIIDKARENIFNNKLSDVIVCVKGSIEEVSLPVSEVDIIVSEWMGYCLLYEAMLPSVLYARDKFLKPNGLLVPSSTTLWIAPIKDDTFIDEHVSYWRDVYGFDMKAMQEGIYDEVRVMSMPKSSLCGSAYPFKVLDLYTTCTEDLRFTADWISDLSQELNTFDGFLIWFDSFFSPSRGGSLPAASTIPAQFSVASRGNVAFTTGPDGPETHWKQGLLLATPQQVQGSIPTLRQLAGKVSFSVHSDNSRALTLLVSWIAGQGEDRQTWELK